MQPRQHYLKLPLQANFYPMPSQAYIQDGNYRLTLHTAQALGVSSLESGLYPVTFYSIMCHFSSFNLLMEVIFETCGIFLCLLCIRTQALSSPSSPLRGSQRVKQFKSARLCAELILLSSLVMFLNDR